MNKTSSISELLSYKERLEQTLKGTASGTFVHDFTNRLLYLDEMAMGLLGVNKTTIEIEEWYATIHPDDLEAAKTTLNKQLKEQSALINLDYRIKSQKNTPTYVEVKSAVKYKGSKPLKTYGIVIDITELKRNEIELLNKNQELEHFVRIVSHDILSPLHSIIGFTDLLRDQCKSLSDENVNNMIKMISDTSVRIKNLIINLSEYSKIGRKRETEEIDCNDLLKWVLNDLYTLIKESNCIVEIEKLPVINGNRVELRRLFQNIIANGIKYQKTGVQPRINISAVHKSDYFKFSVKDNGIGIDERNLERVFLMFEQLHEKHNNEGLGIGLSECKKIVSLYGGKIWVDSIKNEGSTFYFTISTHS